MGFKNNAFAKVLYVRQTASGHMKVFIETHVKKKVGTIEKDFFDWVFFSKAVEGKARTLKPNMMIKLNSVDVRKVYFPSTKKLSPVFRVFDFDIVESNFVKTSKRNYLIGAESDTETDATDWSEVSPLTNY